jgi:hypothetical protein
MALAMYVVIMTKLWRCFSKSATCSEEIMAGEETTGVEMDLFMGELAAARILLESLALFL